MISMADRSAVHGRVRDACKRLLALLNQETAALEQGVPFDMTLNNRKKEQLLLEFMQASKSPDDGWFDHDMKSMIDVLRAALIVNRDIVKRHWDAARALSSIVQTAMRDAEADGTYSRWPSRLGR